jgi:hypothetical protein
VIVTLTCATTVLAIHELFFPHSLFRVYRLGRLEASNPA